MRHLLLSLPHLLHQTPLAPHHHRLLQPPHSSSTTASLLFQKCLPTGKPWSGGGVFMRPPPQPNRKARVIRCMASPRRVERVAQQIMRELSDMLLTDKVIQCAVLPEAAFGADLYLSSLTTISDVEVSSDLQLVKVYVSIFGDKRGKEVSMAGLKSKVKYVRSALGKRMKLRLTPEIRFIEDDSIERGSRVIDILDKLKKEKRKAKGKVDDQYELSDLSEEDDSDWEGDDTEDEGVV